MSERIIDLSVDDTIKPITKVKPSHLGALKDIPLNISVVVGKTTMKIEEVLKMGRGAIIGLDTFVGDKVDIVVNGETVAYGELTILDDKMAVTIMEMKSV